MSYKSALPFFPDEDIENILSEIKSILTGDGFLTKGPRVKEFEQAYAQYTGTKYAIATNSGTSALEIVLKAIALSQTDEVIVPTQTFIATGSSVITAGGKVVFCDADEDFSLDFEDLKRKITPYTKAVIMVHFGGLIHPKIIEIANFLRERNIFLIEDCAHSNGASIDGKISGSIGDFGCHSFYSTKIMTTGEGGMITTSNEKYFYICSSKRSIGIDVRSNAEIFDSIGSNNRMAEIESIIGLSQLKRLDSFVEHRIKIANIYKNELEAFVKDGKLRFQNVPGNVKHPYWKFIVFLNTEIYSRATLRESLLKSGINIDAPYLPLMHLQPIFKKLNDSKEGQMPNAEALSLRHFCLPMHLLISENDAKDIAGLLKQSLTL